MSHTSDTAASIAAANKRRLNARVGFICGSDQQQTIHWLSNPLAGPPDYPGNNDLHKLLDRVRETYRLDWCRIAIAPSYFRQKRRWDFNNLDVAYVSISDPDQNPKVTKIAQRMLSKTQIPVINHPANVQRSTRSDIATASAGVPDVLMPKTVRISKPRVDLALHRIENERMDFPIIMRPVGSHTGIDTSLCRDASALAAALGDAKGAYYLTEFVDFRSTDGLYRKYRFFKIGNDIVFRHLIISDDWFVHVRDVNRVMVRSPALIAEERQIFESGIDDQFPGASERIHQLTQPTGLDYVGIDCSFLDDGRILVFEINATMNFLPMRTNSLFAYTNACLGTATTALRALVEAKIGRPVVPR